MNKHPLVHKYYEPYSCLDELLTATSFSDILLALDQVIDNSDFANEEGVLLLVLSKIEFVLIKYFPSSSDLDQAQEIEKQINSSSNNNEVSDPSVLEKERFYDVLEQVGNWFFDSPDPYAYLDEIEKFIDVLSLSAFHRSPSARCVNNIANSLQDIVQITKQVDVYTIQEMFATPAIVNSTNEILLHSTCHRHTIGDLLEFLLPLCTLASATQSDSQLQRIFAEDATTVPAFVHCFDNAIASSVANTGHEQSHLFNILSRLVTGSPECQRSFCHEELLRIISKSLVRDDHADGAAIACYTYKLIGNIALERSGRRMFLENDKFLHALFRAFHQLPFVEEPETAVQYEFAVSSLLFDGDREDVLDFCSGSENSLVENRKFKITYSSRLGEEENSLREKAYKLLAQKRVPFSKISPRHYATLIRHLDATLHRAEHSLSRAPVKQKNSIVESYVKPYFVFAYSSLCEEMKKDPIHDSPAGRDTVARLFREASVKYLERKKNVSSV